MLEMDATDQSFLRRFELAQEMFAKDASFKPHGTADWIRFIQTHKFPDGDKTLFFSDTLNSLLATVTTDLKSLSGERPNFFLPRAFVVF